MAMGTQVIDALTDEERAELHSLHLEHDAIFWSPMYQPYITPRPPRLAEIEARRKDILAAARARAEAAEREAA